MATLAESSESGELTPQQETTQYDSEGHDLEEKAFEVVTPGRLSNSDICTPTCVEYGSEVPDSEHIRGWRWWVKLVRAVLEVAGLILLCIIPFQYARFTKFSWVCLILLGCGVLFTIILDISMLWWGLFNKPLRCPCKIDWVMISNGLPADQQGDLYWTTREGSGKRVRSAFYWEQVIRARFVMSFILLFLCTIVMIIWGSVLLAPMDAKLLNYNTQLPRFHYHKWFMVSFIITFVFFLIIEMCSIYQEDHEGQKPPGLRLSVDGNKPDYYNPSWNFLFPVQDHCAATVPLATCILCILTLALCVLLARKRARPFTDWMVSNYYHMSYWYAIVGNFLITVGILKTLCDRHTVFRRWQKAGCGYNHCIWFLGLTATMMLPILTVCRNDFVPNDEVWPPLERPFDPQKKRKWGKNGPAVSASCNADNGCDPNLGPEWYYVKKSKTHNIHTTTAIMFFCGWVFYQILHTCAFAYNVMMKGYYTKRTISFLTVWVTVNLSTLVFMWLTAYNQLIYHSGYAVWEWWAGLSLYVYWFPYALIIYLGNTSDQVDVADVETETEEGSPEHSSEVVKQIL